MKKINKFGYAAAGMLLAAAAMQSCAVEEPFGSGEGTLRMKLFINSDVTRAAMNEQELADNCVVYISDQKGLVFKEKGLSNLPEALNLRQGHYVAEAWTGDSVPASFDSKFYRCYHPFDMQAGENSVVLTCKIANVVASVNSATIDETQVKNVKVKVTSPNGELEFTKDNYRTAKGYFMMPYKEDGTRTDELTFTLTGENILGEEFTKTQTVTGVQPAHEYVMNLSYGNEAGAPEGGGYITITIDERENLVSDVVEIFAAPTIEGIGFDIDKQIIGEAGQFSGDAVVKVMAFDEIRSFTIECVDMNNLNLPAQAVDLKLCDDATIAQLHAAGITWDKTVENVENNSDGHTRQLSYIIFSEQYLNSLPERDTEYRIVLTCTDGTGAGLYQGKTTTKTLRIAVGENAIVYDAPIIVEDVATSGNYMAVGAHSATLDVSIKDETASNLGVRYREDGASDWMTATPVVTRATQAVSVKLTGLKAGTRYEYQAVADGYQSESMYFTTEGVFSIPNASLEEWSDFVDNSKVRVPSGDGQITFWDSGNHGSATMSTTLTQGSTEMFHSGSQSARLRSQFVGVGGAIGKFAAGNLFVGKYLETQGTDGRLEFGRPYNGSHPSKLRVYVNYRPGKVEKGGDQIAVGAMDEAQIYVALTTAPIEVRTKKTTQKLFNPNDDEVLAYGQYTFTAAYGPDGQLQMLEIPIEYYQKAKNLKPTHLVIVCSASKYGDYFQGGEGSTMYLDDFELVYE